MILLVFGASGSGTTTLADRLSKQLNIAHLDTDDYYWKDTNPPYTHSRTPKERVDALKRDIVSKGSVVISGSLSDWGIELTPLLSGAVRLTLDSTERLKRLKIREQQRYGSRILPDGDMYEQHIAFLKWAEEYETSTDISRRCKVQHDLWQMRLTCPVIVLDSKNTVEQNVNRVLQWIDINKLNVT